MLISSMGRSSSTFVIAKSVCGLAKGQSQG
jgi:hypothetical protein